MIRNTTNNAALFLLGQPQDPNLTKRATPLLVPANDGDTRYCEPTVEFYRCNSRIYCDTLQTPAVPFLRAAAITV